MEGPLKGWTKKETLLLLKSVKIDFDDLEKKIPDKNRKQIQAAVLFTVNTLADAPPKTTEENMTSDEWKNFIVTNHKIGEVSLPPPEKSIPYFLKVVLSMKEFFKQTSNALRGRPTPSDECVLSVLKALSFQLDTFYEFFGAEAIPELQEFNKLVDPKYRPLPRTPTKEALKQQQKREEKKEKKKKSIMEATNPINYPHLGFNTDNDKPPKYTPEDPSIPPPYSFNVRMSNANPPSYPPMSNITQPLYVPATAYNMNTIYGSAMNAPAKNENPPMYTTSSKSYTPSIHSPATCGINSMFAQATNDALPLYAIANNNLQAPMNAVASLATNIIPSVYPAVPVPAASQTLMSGLVNNYYQPAINAAATAQYDVMHAPANNFNATYGPAAQNNSHSLTNATILPNYAGAFERNFETSNLPAASPRGEPPPRQTDVRAHPDTAGPKKQ